MAETIIILAALVTILTGIVVIWKWGKSALEKVWRFLSRYKPKIPRVTVQIVPQERDCIWQMGEKRGEPIMHLIGRWYVTNITDNEVLILNARLKKNVNVQDTFVLTRHPNSRMFGSYPILAGETTEVSADFWIEPPHRQGGKDYCAKVILTDQYGNNHTTKKMIFKGHPPKEAREEDGSIPGKLNFKKYAPWILWAILLFILFRVTFFPIEPDYWQKHFLAAILALIISLIFCSFVSAPGTISLEFEKNIAKIGKFKIQATGTIAIFVLVFLTLNLQINHNYEKDNKQKKPKIEKNFEDVKPPEINEDMQISEATIAQFKKHLKEYQEKQRWARDKYNKEFEISPTTQMVISGVSLYLGNTAKAVSGSRTIHIEYPDDTNATNLYGLSLWKDAQYEEAKQMFEKALVKDKEKLGPNHPTVANRLINLGDVLVDMALKEEAETKYQRALKILESSYGPNHPRTKLVLKRLDGLKE